MSSDYQRAFEIVWLVLTACSSAVIAVAVFADPAAVTGLLPVCEWKERFGRECPLCGMTTAFFFIGDGQFTAATAANRGSVPLFAAFCVNAAAALGRAWLAVLSRCRARRAHAAA